MSLDCMKRIAKTLVGALEHILQHSINHLQGLIVVLLNCHLSLQTRVLCQMPVGITFLCEED